MHDFDNETILLLNEGKYSELDLEKMFALKAFNGNRTLFESNWFAFEKLCNVLNDIKPNVNIMEPITLLQAAKAIKEIKKYCKDFNPEQEIRQYIANIAHEEGWYKLPEVLNFAQSELNMLQQNIELDEEQKKIQQLKHIAVEKYLEQ